MDAEQLERMWIPHLRGQFERARPILFTGAGFSCSARNSAGELLPTTPELKRSLWNLCFPGIDFEPANSLQDLYDHALLRQRKSLADLLISSLTVDSESLPDWYAEIFSMPWQRVYTLNVDDLASAVSRRFNVPRKINEISATNPRSAAGEGAGARLLDAIHLNGAISDLPEKVTFSTTQYAHRMATQDHWYLRFCSDLLTSPVVFVGTQLDEPPLWQHVAIRQGPGGREMNELRHRSYLVTPSLDRAKQALLAQFNVVWLPMTAEELVGKVFRPLMHSVVVGLRFLSEQSNADKARAPVKLREVSQLATGANGPNEFLLGQEPTWSDIQSNRAITRQVDESILENVRNALGKTDQLPGIVVLTGTAGSGKSASLRRASLRIAAEGVRVAWIDRESDLAPAQIRAAMREPDPPRVLAIDDVDLYGAEAAPLLRDVAVREKGPLLVVAIRSGRVDRFLNPVVLEGVPRSEITMPNLSDRDIGALVDLLQRENRLGILTGKPREEQVRAFREQAGRQMLVALYQATTGEKFEEKAFGELEGLQPDGQLAYAAIAVSSSFRFGLSKDEILIACSDWTNTALNEVAGLVRRHIVVERSDGSIWARHRIIGEIIRDELAKRGLLLRPVTGLARVAAAKISEQLPPSARPWRMVRTFINHDFLRRAIGDEQARNMYGGLETLLSSNYHFWLQRGSLEVELDSLALAEHYLATALSLAPDEFHVLTEWAYLFFRKAIINDGIDAPEFVNSATESLENLMHRAGDPYPYHVLGSQGLAWARRAITNSIEKERYLRRLIGRVEEGCKKHPREGDLGKLLEDLRKEYLGIAVSA